MKILLNIHLFLLVFSGSIYCHDYDFCIFRVKVEPRKTDYRFVIKDLVRIAEKFEFDTSNIIAYLDDDQNDVIIIVKILEINQYDRIGKMFRDLPRGGAGDTMGYFTLLLNQAYMDPDSPCEFTIKEMKCVKEFGMVKKSE